MSNPRTFTDQQARNLREEYEDGATVQQLADSYKTSRMTITRTIVRAGGRMRPRGRPSETTPRGLLGWLTST